MLRHGAEPFPDGHWNTSGRLTFPVQVGRVEGAEDCHALFVQTAVIIENDIKAGGEALVVAGVAVGAPGSGFDEHIPVDASQVPHQIARYFVQTGHQRFLALNVSSTTVNAV